MPDIPGLDATQKELLNMVAAVQPEVTAQLARIGANIGAWAALQAAGTSADLARLPPNINAEVCKSEYREIFYAPLGYCGLESQSCQKSLAYSVLLLMEQKIIHLSASTHSVTPSPEAPEVAASASEM